MDTCSPTDQALKNILRVSDDFLLLRCGWMVGYSETEMPVLDDKSRYHSKWAEKAKRKRKVALSPDFVDRRLLNSTDGSNNEACSCLDNGRQFIVLGLC
jgi:hypothetical protein